MNTLRTAIVLSSTGLVLKSDLDELERNDAERRMSKSFLAQTSHNNLHETLSGSCSGSSQDTEALAHLDLSEGIAVELSPLLIGCELGGTLGSLHENGSSDTSVKARESA